MAAVNLVMQACDSPQDLIGLRPCENRKVQTTEAFYAKYCVRALFMPLFY